MGLLRQALANRTVPPQGAALKGPCCLSQVVELRGVHPSFIAAVDPCTLRRADSEPRTEGRLNADLGVCDGITLRLGTRIGRVTPRGR